MFRDPLKSRVSERLLTPCGLLQTCALLQGGELGGGEYRVVVKDE